MPSTRRPLVLFAAAAGPELGFGHLVRCGALADALGARRELALRGNTSARLTALTLGWTVHHGPQVECALLPDLIVVDDPSPTHRDRWIRLARRAQVPVAAIFDGESELADADLVVDGSLLARLDHRANRCAGPAWAILPPAVLARRRHPQTRDPRRVLVALGGGAHVARVGVAIARAIVRHAPHLRVDLASGFTTAAAGALPPGCRWMPSPSGLADLLSSAGVAVVAGGLTLYEACALGTPSVAVPVVDAQRRAIDAAAVAGAVTAVSRRITGLSPDDVAQAVRALSADPRRARTQAARAARLVDGAGATRVAARLRDLIRSHSGGSRHAA